MATKLAIHDAPGSYSDRWFTYCSGNNIEGVAVNCYSSSIIEKLGEVQGLLWHWQHYNHADHMIARHVINAAQKMRIAVFPNLATCIHYDDKIGQKYYLEAVKAPIVPTFIFYEQETAMEWINTVQFPKVFKLKGGASSSNVILTRTRGQARSLVRQAFGKGFNRIPAVFSDSRVKFKRMKKTSNLWNELKRLPSVIKQRSRQKRFFQRERGYIYFQEFMPGNDCDIRITVIGDRAFGFRRLVRPGDFRASGSGNISYDPDKIAHEFVTTAFETARKLKAQSLAFDFIRDQEGKPAIVEISYCYMSEAVHACTGHWDPDLNWHEGQVYPEHAILEDLLDRINGR